MTGPREDADWIARRRAGIPLSGDEARSVIAKMRRYPKCAAAHAKVLRLALTLNTLSPEAADVYRCALESMP